MAVFLELRCELRGRGLTGMARCWSDDNAGPQMLVDDTHSEVRAATGELFATAHREGWARWGNGWVCPVCSANAEAVITGQQDEANEQQPAVV